MSHTLSKIAISAGLLTLAVTSFALPVKAQETRWGCYLNSNRQNVGGVTIWWGHRSEDATWACNNWIPTCGNDGGCSAFPEVILIR
jgi:hypothetical protein